MRYLYYLCSMEKENKTITAAEAYTTAVGAFKMANDKTFKDINEKIIKAAGKGLFKIWVSPLSYDGFNDEIVSRLTEMGYTIEDGRLYGGLVYIKWETPPPPIEVGGEGEEPIKSDDVWGKNVLKIHRNGKYKLTYRDTDKLVDSGYWDKYEFQDCGGVELYVKNNEGILKLLASYRNEETDIIFE